MTSPERAVLVAHARRAIEKGSKSFRFASRLFDRRTRERSWLLYCWCRACDDLADGQTHGHRAQAVADPERRLRYIEAQTRLALAGRRSMDPPFDALRLVADECALPPRFVADHLAGFARDAEGWRPDTEEDLLSYCYQVAGVVGCMMALVMGVCPDDEETLDRACDLGIAFQLANIARDLGEDHSVGRCYLPAAWLDEVRLSRCDYMDADKRDRLLVLAQRLCRYVQAYQASARVGAAQLSFRSRWAVLSAARIYGAIGTKVAERGSTAWDSRTIVPRSEKLRHVAAAAAEALARPQPIDRSGLWRRPR
ncbi:phytoene/squalene synthase family protein [Sphingosinicella sp. LY1275]|uniref:phytoene/squalene synthase family protein n=1 Tax=Sphingosinicella sp. LY1275 TaxID=3095379 RepID=UPI002ADECF62|nr:phytoene/squalene synthase family protein [Sphingosinicella sp. LY1275]MEA1015290.1 phytoene/squalene synthase family protein [Sphingosinicella sp. LY1275]